MTTDRERVALPEMHEAWLPREHSLHRPRHANRQRFALACAVVFLVLPAVGYAFGVRPTAFENHRLASFPSPSLGWVRFGSLIPVQATTRTEGWSSR